MVKFVGDDSVLLDGALIFDGTGRVPFEGWVLVKSGRIAAVGRIGSAPTTGVTRYGLGGMALAPGFVNIHSHSDTDMLRNPESKTLLMQGVTTEVVGNCGGGPVSAEGLSEQRFDALKESMRQKGALEEAFRWSDLSGYLEMVRLARPAANVAALFGHGDVREKVLGPREDGRPLGEEDRQKAASLAQVYMEQGAFGMSSGLEYVPGRCADVAELSSVARSVALQGGIHASHIRNEGPELLESVEEILEVARRSGVRSEISHLKAVGPANWGRVRDALGVMDAALEDGIEMTADFYPYLASSTELAIVLPDWVLEKGKKAGLNTLKDPDLRPKAETESDQRTQVQGGWERIVVTSVPLPEWKWMEGLHMGEISSRLGMRPAAAAMDILLATQMGVRIVRFAISEEDLIYVMRHPETAVITDGSNGVPADGKIHPRSVGTFPRVLGHYARDLGVISMEEAVRKMTGLPAHRLGIRDRGIISPGFWADLVVFDPGKIIDKATYDDPWQYPEGIYGVLVNGEIALWEGELTGIRAGRALRKNQEA